MPVLYDMRQSAEILLSSTIFHPPGFFWHFSHQDPDKTGIVEIYNNNKHTRLTVLNNVIQTRQGRKVQTVKTVVDSTTTQQQGDLLTVSEHMHNWGNTC